MDMRLRMTKTGHAALLLAIPYLLAHPERYAFMRSDIPTRRRPGADGEAPEACLLAWVGHFMGLGRRKGGIHRLSVVARALGFDSDWEFYRWMDAREDRATLAPDWHESATSAVRYLKMLARCVPV